MSDTNNGKVVDSSEINIETGKNNTDEKEEEEKEEKINLITNPMLNTPVNNNGEKVKKQQDNCPSKDKEPQVPIDDTNYKDQAQIFHPNQNTGCAEDATEKFKILNNLNEKRKQEEAEGNGEEVKAIEDSSNNFRYAIIRINTNKEISVIDDKSSEDFSKESPYALLSEKTPSVFAIKITKKNKNDCRQEANKKCINNDMFDSTYELDLTTIVDKGDLNDNNLISEGFLNAMGKPSDDTNSNALTIVDSKVASEKTVGSEEMDDSKDDSKVASQETVPNEEASDRVDLIHKLEEMELLDFYLKSDMDKKILDKHPITEEEINNLIEEIFKKKDEKVDETAAKPKNDKHGNFGLPNIGKVCYISSLIHLLKDIKTYKPTENDSDPINSLTAKLFKNIEEGKTSEYDANYRALVTAFGKVPSKEGDPSDILDQYKLGSKVAKEIITAEGNQSIQDVFNDKKNALTADYAIFTINRAVFNIHQSEWEKIDITSPENYELAGKILHPPGHFVYVNYDDQNKPILYDDSRVEEFKKSSEKDGKTLFAPGIEKYDELLAEYKEISQTIYQQTGKPIETIIEEYKKAEQEFLDKNNLYKSFNYDEQRYDMQDRIVTMVLYKKKAAAAITGGSRKNRAQKSKKTKRKYYVYRK